MTNGPITMKMALQQLQALQAEAVDLEAKHLRLMQARVEAKRAMRAASADMGCECDANYCHTEKNNEVVAVGETDTFCHDDQDRGSLSVHCNAGEIEVIVSTAVWSEFTTFDSKRLRSGESWRRDIPSMSSWYDQTNRVEVVGKADSRYNLDFKSWDD